MFSPELIGFYTISIIVHTVCNPFEPMPIKILGEAYQKDVTLSRLDCEILQSKIDETDMEYILDFGTCLPKKKYIKKFSIHNNSDSIIRFEIISESSELLFIPSIGHIFQSSVKDIEAFLMSSTAKVIEVSYP